MVCSLGVSTNVGLHILSSINGLAGPSNLYLFVYYGHLLLSSCILNGDIFSQPVGHLESLTLDRGHCSRG